jgi:hypothetical protein
MVVLTLEFLREDDPRVKSSLRQIQITRYWKQKVDTILIGARLKRIQNVTVHSEKGHIYA